MIDDHNFLKSQLVPENESYWYSWSVIIYTHPKVCTLRKTDVYDLFLYYPKILQKLWFHLTQQKSVQTEGSTCLICSNLDTFLNLFFPSTQF